MPRVFYRLTDTTDAEERLEDAAMSKALHDVLGEDLAILPEKGIFPEHGLHFGRSKRIETQPRTILGSEYIPYWEDPAFQAHTKRDWGHFDLSGAEAKIARLQGGGKGAFLKSTLGPKHMTAMVQPGEGLMDTIGPMVYSFCDRPACLLVQEAVDMRFERRFIVMNGEVVTQSPVAYHLTPLSRFIEPGLGVCMEELHYATPTSRAPIHSPDLTARMTSLARQMASECAYDHVCIDLCLIGDDIEHGDIEPIEYNPMNVGMIGLFACDPYAIAQSVQRYLELNPEIGRYKEAAHPCDFLQEEGDPYEDSDFDVA